MNYEAKRRIFVNNKRLDELEKLEDHELTESEAWEIIRIKEPDSILVKFETPEVTLGLHATGVYVSTVSGVIYILHDPDVNTETGELNSYNSNIVYIGNNFVNITTAEFPSASVCKRDGIEMAIPIDNECAECTLYTCFIKIIPMPMDDDFQKNEGDETLKFPISWMSEKHRTVPALCSKGSNICIPEVVEYFMPNRFTPPIQVQSTPYSESMYVVDIMRAECKRIYNGNRTLEGLTQFAVIYYRDKAYEYHLGRIVSIDEDFINRKSVTIKRLPENKAEFENINELTEVLNSSDLLELYLGTYPVKCNIFGNAYYYSTDGRSYTTTILTADESCIMNDIKMQLAFGNYLSTKQPLITLAEKYKTGDIFYLFLGGGMTKVSLFTVGYPHDTERREYELIIDGKLISEEDYDD